jgi:endonuclease/exonuclease/phosphatase family metal-dependent hydrolase
MYYVYYPASVPPSSGRDFGNAVLSPWPIEQSQKILLPHRSRIIHQARAAVAATVRVAGQPIRVYSVHLTSPLGTSASKRREQAAVVIADALASPDPVIVAGDFNSKGLGTRFEAAGFVWLTKEVGRTAGLFSFDHIFVRGLALAGETRASVAREGPKASDHRPVWAELVTQ